MPTNFPSNLDSFSNPLATDKLGLSTTPHSDHHANANDAVEELEKVTVGPLVYNVKGYGATGDGSTDDTSAVSDALDAAHAAGGGVVFFPEGTFSVTGISKVLSNVVLRGSGMESTTISLANGSDTDVLKFSSGSNGITLEGLTIDGAGQAATSRGVQIDSATGVILRQCRVQNTLHRGVYLFQCTDIAIDGCEIIDCGAATASDNDGIALWTATRAKVTRNTIRNTGWYGIILGSTGAVDVVIADNIVDSAGAIGIAGGGGNTLITVSGNVVRDCTGNGIDFGANRFVTITGNAIENCNGGIIQDNGAQTNEQFVAVTGNTINGTTAATGASGAGIAVRGASVIVGNTVIGAAAAGLNVTTSKNVTIVGNVAKNNTVAGINIYGDGTTPSDGVTVIGNRCYDDQATPTQDYGIRNFNGAGGANNDNLVIVNNDLRGNGTQAIAMSAGSGAAPASSIVQNNLGNSDTLLETANTWSALQTLADAVNLALGTVTGSQIGTSAAQKLAFFGATPIAQPANTSDLKDALVALGLLADGDATPLDLDGGRIDSGQIRAGLGTSNNVSYGFEGVNNSGIYSFGGNDINIVTNGTVRMSFSTVNPLVYFPLPSAVQLRINAGNGQLDWGLGDGTVDTNLYRSAADVLKTDDRFEAADSVTIKTKAGVPADTDFAQTPPNGTLALDTTNSALYARVGGAWVSVALT